MRRNFDLVASPGKIYAKSTLATYLDPNQDISLLKAPSRAAKRKVNALLAGSESSIYNLESIVIKLSLKERVYKAYDASLSQCTEDEFKSALEEFLLDDYLQKLKMRDSNRQDVTLIDSIIQKLESKSWSMPWTKEFSMAEKIHCAQQLMDYLDDEYNYAAIGLTSAIADNIVTKYPTLSKRFATEIQSFNDNIRRKKVETVIDPKFYGYPTADKADRASLKEERINVFFYCGHSTPPTLYFVGSDKKRRIKIDTAGIDKDELNDAIDNENLSKLQKLLGDKFPNEINLTLAKTSFKPRTRTDYFRARLGGITKFSESKKHKSAGDKTREKKRREDVTYHSTLNPRADNLRGATILCNELATEYGFDDARNKDIGFEVFEGDSLDSTLKSTKENRFILHIASGKPKLFYVYYIAEQPIQVPIKLAEDAIKKLSYDLIYIVTNEKLENHNPTLRAQDLSVKYSSKILGNKNKKYIDKCPDLINFIIDATGYVPDDALRNQYIEMDEIQRVSTSLEAEINDSNLTAEQQREYRDVLNTVKNISTLPYAYFRTSESVIPRYKCKEILTKLERKFAIDSEEPIDLSKLAKRQKDQRTIDQEYFRSSYKLYELKYMPSDPEIKARNHKNPRFYYCPESKDIAYVDALGVIHRSKLKPRVNTGSDFDYYANAVLDTSPEKLSNLLAKKTKVNGAYTLDSEEVFKYISLKVEAKDKDGFKMCTVNEELEIILADEAATTRDALKNLCMTALYAALVIMLVLVPGFNLAFFAALSVGIGYFPNFFDSVALGSYKDALRNAGMAVFMIAIMASLAFIPGLNFVSVGAAAGAMVYVTLAIASLTTAFYLSATISAASKNPKVKEANKQLVTLKDQIKAFTLQDDPNAHDDDDAAHDDEGPYGYNR